MTWIKGKRNQKNKNETLIGYSPSYGPKKSPIPPVGGSGVSKPIAKEGPILNEGFLPQLKKIYSVLDESQKEESFFPILIQYADTKEYATCKQPSDINVGKRFKIIKMNFK